MASELFGWVIWSRRPQDPSHAPGVIIAAKAFPPTNVVDNAADLPTPPPSPKVPSVQLAPAEPTDEMRPVGEPADEIRPVDEPANTSPDECEVPSSSVTESTPASSTPGETPVPGSPATSRTSISLPVTSPGKNADASVSTDTPKPDIPAAVPSSVEAAPDVSFTSSAQSAEVQQTPAPVPVPAKPVAKKSWASLLQSSDSTASSSRSRLPTSSVVGFSIPAAAMAGSSAGHGVVPRTAAVPHRNELLKLLHNGPPPANTPPKIQPRGLINTGNMCFANAVLQILVYCQPFSRLFSELSKYLVGPVAGSQKEGTKATPLVDAIIQFMKEFAPESPADPKAKGKERDDFYEPEAFIPSYVYDAMKEKKRFASMIGGHQEDAEEFLGFFLDTLEEELLSLSLSLSPTATKPSEDASVATQDDGWYEVGKKNRAMITRTVKSTESPITRIFGGKFRSILRAPHQKDSVTIEDWRSLRLDIQRDTVHSIKDALQSISQPQPVQISQPTRPGVVVEATQQALIELLPPVLVLHLKRFHYDTNVGDVVKIGKQVAYGPELDISPDLVAPTRRTAQSVKYQLFGVLYHHGQSASGGHYTLDVLHPNRDLTDRPRAAWIRIDDELVSDIRPDDVFGGLEQNERCAYLLFYRRLGAWGPART
ncbi:cysteine proteinase [Daedalea quercina L-15889]|uniref:Ubiquitin carboxyl-terminal hydrolase n=1 Tax=Daedalea quercina L-15889 TaxID=1314783 RepID=A0A165RZD0_9APHY|nr:cysteine proteinase [Daedalea quercina L-15889]